MQFLQENGLNRTLKVLYEESGVVLNTVPEPEAFIAAVREGNWNVVMNTLQTIQIPPQKLYDLYELLFVELLLGGELDAARLVLRQSNVLQNLRDDNQNGKGGEARYLKLEAALLSQASNGIVKSVETLFQNGATTIDEQRDKVASSLRDELVVVPKSRLLSIIGEALNARVQTNELLPDTVYDVFHGVIPKGSFSFTLDKVDSYVSKCYSKREFLIGSHVEAATFSSNGQYLAIGLSDGFVELVNPVTGQLLKNLSFQTDETRMIVMENPIISMDFSNDNSILAVATHKGEVAIWRLDDGNCIRRLPPSLHKDGGVLLVRFGGRDGQMIITGGYDGVLKVSGLRSGKVIKEFKHHSSFITDCFLSSNGNLLYSCGADGLVCIWDIRLASLVKSLNPFSQDHLSHESIQNIIPNSNSSKSIFVISKSGQIVIMSEDGKVQSRPISTPSIHGNVITTVTSPKHCYIYLIHENGQVTCYDTNSWIVSTKFSTTFNPSAPEQVIGATSHPLFNQLVVFGTNGSLSFWKPPC